MSTLILKQVSSLCLIAILLAGCGGGATPSKNVPQAAVSSVGEQPLFSATPILLPDLRPAFDQLCGNATQIRDILPVDLNRDGRQDLVLTLNCLQPIWGTPVVGPATAGFVVFLQVADGSFVDATQQLFGVTVVRTTGIIINAITQDFNNDGYDDIVFALNREDGRAQTDSLAINLNDVNLFMTSNGDGSYSLVQQGQTAWNYSLDMLDNAAGGKDFVSQPVGYVGVNEQWTLNAGWRQLTPLNWAANGTVFLNRAAPGEPSTVAVSPDWTSNTLGVALYKRSTDWTRVNSVVIGSFITVPWKSWSGNVETTSLVTIANVDYVGVTLELSCQIRLKPTDTSNSAIFMLQSTPLKNRYVPGTTLTEGDTTTFSDPVNTLVQVTTTGDTIAIQNLPVSNEVLNTNTFRLYCGDVNGDGFDDVVVSDYRPNTQPLIYINDGLGSFKRLDMKNVPNSGLTVHQAFILKDITGDGFADLLYYPAYGVPTTGPVTLKIFKGTRNIRPSDLM